MGGGMELEAAFWILLPAVVYLSICCCGGGLSSGVKGQRSKVTAFVLCAFVTRPELVDRYNPDMLETFEATEPFTCVFRALSPSDPSEPLVIHPTYPPELRYPTYNLTDMTKGHALCLCLSSQLPGSNVPTSIDLSIYLFI